MTGAEADTTIASRMHDESILLKRGTLKDAECDVEASEGWWKCTVCAVATDLAMSA